jgi:hypothetical protein
MSIGVKNSVKISHGSVPLSRTLSRTVASNDELKVQVLWCQEYLQHNQSTCGSVRGAHTNEPSWLWMMWSYPQASPICIYRTSGVMV